jgi:penicillin-binding protein 1A
VPVAEMQPPAGVVNVGGEWFYDEYARNGGIPSLGTEAAAGATEPGAQQAPPAPEERNRILDLFKN